MSLTDLPYAFTTHRAREVGLTGFRLRGLVDRGSLARPRRGVYVRTAPPLPAERRAAHLALAAAALETYGDGYALCDVSAAAAFDLPLPLGPLDTVHLLDLSSAGKTRRAPGLVVHSSDSYDVTLEAVGGLLTTAATRTVADCLRTGGPRVSVPIADAALHRGLTGRGDLLEEMSMQCHWPGRSRAGDAAFLVDGRRESWLESYAFVRLAEWGVPLPEPQVVVLDTSGRFVARVDGAWLEDATVLELDGRGKYDLPTAGAADPRGAWEREKRRYDEIGNLGAERVRFGLADLLRPDGRVIAAIRARRAVGSLHRFSGRFVVPPSSDLTL